MVEARRASEEGRAGERSAPAAAARGRACRAQRDAPPQPARRAKRGPGMQGMRSVHRRAHRAEDRARRLQRAPARRSAGRFLVQPLQRLRRQGADARSTSPSTSARRSGRTCWAISASCWRRPRRARRCSSTSTTRAARTRRSRSRREPARYVEARAYARGRRPQGHAGDARPDAIRSAEHPDRHQRELRARADGAPHARRRRRLHAAGRRQRRARA